MKVLNGIAAFLLIGMLASVIVLITREDMTRIGGWVKVPEDYAIVPADTLAKWDSISKLPPTIRYDTIYRDTGTTHIIYKDPPLAEPVSADTSTYLLRDSIITGRFISRHTMALRINNGMDEVLSNTWAYRYTGPTEIIKTVERQVIAPMPYEVQVSANGFYLGLHTDVSQYLYSFGADVDFIRGRFVYGGYVERQLLFDERKTVAIGGRITFKIK